MEKRDDGMHAYYMLGLRIVGDFGATLAVPAVLAAVLGTRLDAAWGTRPTALLVALAASALLSALMIRKKASRYGTLYQDLVNRYDHPADRR